MGLNLLHVKVWKLGAVRKFPVLKVGPQGKEMKQKVEQALEGAAVHSYSCFLELRVLMLSNPFKMISSYTVVTGGHPISRGCFACTFLCSWGDNNTGRSAEPGRRQDGSLPVWYCVLCHHVTFCYRNEYCLVPGKKKKSLSSYALILTFLTH